MPHILHLDSSPRGSRSTSRALTKEFVSDWIQVHPQDTVTYRDIGKYPVPPVDESWIAAAFNKANTLPTELTGALTISDELIAELLQADRYVFGVPMYNFSIPANFKAYIDQVVRIHRTFNAAWEGLLTNKKMLIVTSRGDSYGEGSALASYDFQEPYLRTVFGFIGITDITVFHAENLNEGKDSRQQAIAQVRHAMQQLIVSW
ncbi:fmn-dependent nadh-azoreductase [Leptolyngbya sp. Heron Island J]|uniref:FMN-dependent NADH-azoreductase n=1 Tax=Leptolyngbya sp. Heron Island J TaxID=1385935 RepID=UPI0003B94E41|nr:NAD(P)H-dependent oxidoreductase [Leptolyngbya sp. Heron Island J]ESA38700.1 fmn-dependent nadh-azoreductase [Leptolyngbya sp. Heron Island J]